jgi:ferritin-like metal-binding protein YciE
MLREGADALREIYRLVSDIYSMERKLSGVIAGMIEDLDDAEVHNMV